VSPVSRPESASLLALSIRNHSSAHSHKIAALQFHLACQLWQMLSRDGLSRETDVGLQRDSWLRLVICYLDSHGSLCEQIIALRSVEVSAKPFVRLSPTPPVACIRARAPFEKHVDHRCISIGDCIMEGHSCRNCPLYWFRLLYPRALWQFLRFPARPHKGWLRRCMVLWL